MQKNIKVIQNRCECFSEFQKAFGKINRTFEVYLDCFGITLGYYTLGCLGFDLTKKANLFDTLHGNAQYSHNYNYRDTRNYNQVIILVLCKGCLC